MRKPAKPIFKLFQNLVFCIAAWLIGVILAASIRLPVLAQTPPIELTDQETALVITGIDSREFPSLKADLRYLPGIGPYLELNADMLTLLEDGVTIRPNKVQASYQGIHFALAFDPNFKLELRDANGLSPFRMIQEKLLELETFFEPGADDLFTLVIPPDTKLDCIESLRELNETLSSYTQNMRKMDASLNSLADALGILKTDRSGKDKILLWVSPSPNMRYMELFSQLMESAQQDRVRVFVWLVGTASELESGTGQIVAQMSAATGGAAFSFDGNNTLPDLKTYFEGAGQSYTVSYQSGVRQSGEHFLVAECSQCSDPNMQSEAYAFNLDVQAPALELIAPPQELELRILEDGSADPAELPLEVLISFPDSFPRELIRTQLLVNGSVELSNEKAPFTHFILPLKNYSEMDSLRIQAQVYDSLGLTGYSETIDIALQVYAPAKTQGTPWYSNAWIWAGFAAAVLLVAVVLLGKVKPYPKPVKAMPLNAFVEQETPQKSLGTLLRLDADGQTLAEKPIHITEEITLIGTDPQMVQLVLDDPALEAMHAQLRIYPDGSARITDFDSTAGTFVNYAAAGTKGLELQHGDLLIIGSRFYRFNLTSGLSAKPKSPNQ